MRVALGEQGTAAESRTALAQLDLLEGKAASAEALARGAASVFAAQTAPGNEATSRVIVALAQLALGRRDTATCEIAHAESLVKNAQQVLYRLPVAIASARVAGESNPSAAFTSLDAVRAEASRRGIPRFEFEARQAAAEIERRRSAATGEQRLAELRRAATARGFLLYAK